MPVRGKQFHIEFDFSEVEKRLKLLEHLTQQRAKQALEEIAKEVLTDSLTVPPTVPKRTGTLRASGSAFVNHKLVATTGGLFDMRGTPNTSSPGIVLSTPNKPVATIGFNTQYAAAMHERGPYDYTEPGSGRKYLESKLTMFRDKYLSIFARKVRV